MPLQLLHSSVSGERRTWWLTIMSITPGNEMNNDNIKLPLLLSLLPFRSFTFFAHRSHSFSRRFLYATLPFLLNLYSTFPHSKVFISQPYTFHFCPCLLPFPSFCAFIVCNWLRLFSVFVFLLINRVVSD